MPARNAIKTYVEQGYYHIYNRGVEKRNIFVNDLDYAVFSGYLKEYLTPKNEKAILRTMLDASLSGKEKAKAARIACLNNFSSDISLLAYCLMPNHFHFFIKQQKADGIDRFMNSLCTRYTMYFNRSHERVGTLYQGVYKAVLMSDEGQYLHISRYIHRQALAREEGQGDFPSSYPEYLGLRKTDWVHPEEILSFFSDSNSRLSYKAFVNEYNPLYDDSDMEFEMGSG